MSQKIKIFNNGRGMLPRDCWTALLHGLNVFVVIAALLCLNTMAQTDADVPGVKALKPALQAMGTVTEFHRMAMGEPEVAAEKFFEDRCYRRWKQRMEPLRKQQLVDFFVGSMEITGSYDKTSAVSALYNPFWDTILLLELKLSEAGGYGIITKFAMLAGETFRGEKPGKYPFKTVVAKRPYFIELAIVFSKTAEQFDKTFPQKATPSLGEFALSDFEDELKLINMRSLMRIKYMKDLLSDQEDTKIMKSLQIALHYGKRNHLNELFPDSRSLPHIRTLMALPDDVREQFVIYSCYKTPDSTVFAYIPLFMPRLVAIIVFPKDQSKSLLFEIYDLNDSKEILAALSKNGGDKK